MKERQPTRRTQRQKPSWDIEAASQVFDRPAVGEYHPAFGHGMKWSLSESASGENPRLYLYPERFMARYWSDFLSLDLFNVCLVTANGKLLRVESMDSQGKAVMLIGPHGSVALSVTPMDQPTPLDKGGGHKRG